jgi:DNA-binding IclR family transcriptional regulator
MKNDNTVQAVSRTLKIMELLSKTAEYGVSELARSLRCQKSTVFRLLATLKKEGFIVQDSKTEKYSLTLKLFRIGSAVVNNLDLNKAAAPVLCRLSRLTAETIHLCALDNNQMVYLQKVESTHALKVTMMSRIGESSPFYCTGVGKILLAYQEEAYIQNYLKQAVLKKFTDHTITDSVKLVEELYRTRTNGIAYDNEEHELGVRCVAAPVFDQTGTVIAALSISGPTVRVADEKIGAWEKLVRQGAAEISTLMGSPEP